MKATVCQLHEPPDHLEAEWRRLAEHVDRNGSDLVLLPEMPFHAWLARDREVDSVAWEAAVEAHDLWVDRLTELAPTVVLGSRPVTRDGRRFNQGFIVDVPAGYRGLHDKFYLPDEEMFWEASWYERGDGSFEIGRAADAMVGYLICTEMWFTEHARAYARGGVHILASPRATPGATAEKWIAGGRAAAVTSGAYCLSSNRGGIDRHGAVWAGTGWIIEPEEGEVLGVTTIEQPFVTCEIDLERAAAAKSSYPRYVKE